MSSRVLAIKGKFSQEDGPIRLSLLLTISSFIIFGFIMDKVKNIFTGLKHIILEPDYLITDYIGIGGIGAAFVNAGVLTLIMYIILFNMKDIKFSSMTIAALLTFLGFSLFGKNLGNIWPIFFGVFLFAKFKKEPFSKHIYTGIYGTAISPVITSVAVGSEDFTPIALVIAIVIGVVVGFFLPALAGELVKFHQGFDLYNIGFVSGMVGTMLMFFATSYGFIQKPRLVWTDGNNLSIGILMFIISMIFIVIGIWKDKKGAIESFKDLLKDTGRLFGVGYVERHGYRGTLINVGVLGLFATLFVVVVKGDLNGPVLAGVSTIMGFGAMGKNLKNIIPILIGIILGALTKGKGLNEPSIILACLFGTGAAPVVGEFGVLIGIFMGFVHSAFVLNVGFLNGGYNLYNNGFSIGLMMGFFLPILEIVTGKSVPRLGDKKQLELVENIKIKKPEKLEDESKIKGNLKIDLET